MKRVSKGVQFAFHCVYRCKDFIESRITLWYRILRRLHFRRVRALVYFGFRLWLRKIENIEKLPEKGPVIIVSNHTSYYDWGVLSAVYDKKYIVFLANQDLLRRKIVSWLMRLNILIYIDPQKPGFSYFRDVLRRLKQGHIVVIYPEGTRSKSGRMIEPKTGFVKLALLTKVPIVPLAMKGANEILPPHRRIPSVKQCEIIVGDPCIVGPENPMFADIFEDEKENGLHISDAAMKEIAFRIMDMIAEMAGQEWDESVEIERDNFLGRARKVLV